MTTTIERPITAPLDHTGATLAQLVAAQLGVDRAEPTEMTVEEHLYAIPALTTAGRHLVRGRARVEGTNRAFSFFVKHVRSAAHAPMLRELPESLREKIGRDIPWRVEPAVYASDLADRLPAGLVMPRCYHVAEHAESAILWLDMVEMKPHDWSSTDLGDAAYLLGRLAASDAVAPLAPIAGGLGPVTARGYVEERVRGQLLPVLSDRTTWQHPIAAPFRPLREQLMGEVARLYEHLEVLESTPQGAAHGDACPNNLLRTTSRADLTLIDFGFWSRQPLGHDLGQLLIGEVQLGRRPAAALAADEEAARTGYMKGLHAEGVRLSERDLLQAHAAQLMVYAGFSLLPVELLRPDPSGQDLAVAEQRADALAFVLSLVETARGRRFW